MEKLSFCHSRNVVAFHVALLLVEVLTLWMMGWGHHQYRQGGLTAAEFAALEMSCLTLLAGIAGALVVLRRLIVAEEQHTLDREARLSQELNEALRLISSDREAEGVAGCQLATGLLPRLNRDQRLAVEGTIQAVIGWHRWPLNLMKAMPYVGCSSDGRLKAIPDEGSSPETDIHADTIEHRLWFSNDPKMRLLGRVSRYQRTGSLRQPFESDFMVEELATLAERSKLRLFDDEEHDLPEPPL